MTVETLKNLEIVIKPILEEIPQTRDDDVLLYAEIVRAFNPKALELTANTFLFGHSYLNIPNMKSVERARRKVQEKYPDLASERAKKKRAKEEQAYIAYSKT